MARFLAGIMIGGASAVLIGAFLACTILNRGGTVPASTHQLIVSFGVCGIGMALLEICMVLDEISRKLSEIKNRKESNDGRIRR